MAFVEEDALLVRARSEAASAADVSDGPPTEPDALTPLPALTPESAEKY